jgi:hypothetical protein
MHSLTNEGMRGNFATGTDACVFLHLYKGADFCIISDTTTVKVDETFVRDGNIVSQFNGGCDGHGNFNLGN